MSKLLPTAILLFCINQVHAQDTLYFDQEWKPCTKREHAYFRPLPLKKNGELLLLQDYYKNGNLQMQGYVMADRDEYYVGDIYWYDEQGMDAGVRQYFNHSKQKKLTYYNPDNTVWMTIDYDQGGKKRKVDTYYAGQVVLSGKMEEEKLSGSFPSPFYAHNRQRIYEIPVDGEEETVEAPLIEAIPGPMMSYGQEEQKTEYAFSIIVLWQNGKKATEIKYGYHAYGYLEKITQQSWGENGQSVSDVAFLDPNRDAKQLYNDIAYYTHNFFAVHPASIIPVSQDIRHGIAAFYRADGSLDREEKFDDGIFSEVKFYHENGTLDRVNTYRDGLPYDGTFSEDLGLIEVVYTLRDGSREGETYSRDRETGQIVDRGVYKNGSPYQGVVYVVAEAVHRANYEKGQLDGLQMILDNNGVMDTLETYEMRMGKRQGERKIFRDEEVYTSVYHEDKIKSGTVIEDRNLFSYKEGLLVERKMKTNAFEEEFGLLEQFENGVLKSVTYANFTIKENPQDRYTGIFKDGIPYDGYFALDTLLDDMMLVDYYEKGRRVFQYYFDFLEQLESYRHYTYDRKSTFDSEGNIIQGISYRLAGQNTLYSTHYNQGKPNRLDVNLFAMHYFNRFSMELRRDSILLSDMQSPINMKIYREDDFVTAALFENENVLYTRGVPQQVEVGAANSMTSFYLEHDEIKAYSVHMPSYEGVDGFGDNQMISQLYFLFPLQVQEGLPVFFEKLIGIVQLESEEDTWYKALSSYSIGSFDEENYLGYLQYDADKTIDNGIRPRLENGQSIVLESVFQGKVLLTKRMSVQELRKDQKQIMQAFLTEHMDAINKLL